MEKRKDEYILSEEEFLQIHILINRVNRAMDHIPASYVQGIIRNDDLITLQYFINEIRRIRKREKAV